MLYSVYLFPLLNDQSPTTNLHLINSPFTAPPIHKTSCWINICYRICISLYNCGTSKYEFRLILLIEEMANILHLFCESSLYSSLYRKIRWQNERTKKLKLLFSMEKNLNINLIKNARFDVVSLKWTQQSPSKIFFVRFNL